MKQATIQAAHQYKMLNDEWCCKYYALFELF
jgi:hypothetical protein